MKRPSPDPWDPEFLRLEGANHYLQAQESATKASARLRTAFLRGPIPWPWLLTALRLPHRALHVGLLLWKVAGCRQRRVIRFRLAWGRELHLSRSTTQRGLAALVQAGLVSVRHLPGQCSEVTIEDLTEQN